MFELPRRHLADSRTTGVRQRLNRVARSVSIAVLSIALAGCGGAEKTAAKSAKPSLATPQGSLVPRLGARCFDQQTRLEKRVHAEKARPMRISVRRSPVTARFNGAKAKPMLAGEVMLDDVFATAVRKGRVRSAFVLGLAGTGKSAFAKTLEQRICEDLPTVVVRATKIADGGSGNPVLAAAAARFGLKLPKDQLPGANINAGLAGKPWLLVLDGIDELPLTRRPDVLVHVRSAIKKWPAMRMIVIARPPIYTPAFKLPEITGVLELMPQTCDDVDASLQAWKSKDSRLANIDKLLASYKLNAKVKFDGECHLRQVMTWRDVTMAMDLARSAEQGHYLAPAETFDGSRSALFALWIKADLDMVLKRAGVAPDRALELIDRMMHTISPKVGGPLVFRSKRCEITSNSMALTGTSDLCRLLFRAHIFSSKRSDGTFVFANRSVEEWFIAHRINEEMKRAANPSCDVVGKLHQLYESTDIAAFLLGMSEGRRCTATALRTLCSSHCEQRDLARIAERGLPTGPTRAAAIANARKELVDGAPESKCALKVLDSLAK